MQITYSKKYLRQFKKLPRDVQVTAVRRVKDFFLADPFHPTLLTHKLSGRLKEFWAFSIDKKYRIIFEFSGRESVNFLFVGDHSIYS